MLLDSFNFPSVRGNDLDAFEALVGDIIRYAEHANLALTIARFGSDVGHDMGDKNRIDRINNGKLGEDQDAKTLFKNHLYNNPKIREAPAFGHYDGQNGEELLRSIQLRHGDPQIGVLNPPTSKFSIQQFMNLEIPQGYYLDVNIGEEPTREHIGNVIGIIDKGSEGLGVQPGDIWADGNMWFLDGLKPIPKNLDDFRNALPDKLKDILSEYIDVFFINMLKSIAQEYFNSILNDMFDVNNFYITSSEHK